MGKQTIQADIGSEGELYVTVGSVTLRIQRLHAADFAAAFDLAVRERVGGVVAGIKIIPRSRDLALQFGGELLCVRAAAQDRLAVALLLAAHEGVTTKVLS